MSEDRDLREVPTNMWAYLGQIKETAQVCQWVWRELISRIEIGRASCRERVYVLV